MTNNPILDELHTIRERLLAESGGTVSGLIARLQAEQAASDRPLFKATAITALRPSGESTRPEVENLSSPPDDG